MAGPEDGGFGAALEPEFMEDGLDVGLSGVGGDAEGAGYLFVAHTLGDKGYHLGFAWGEAIKVGMGKGSFEPGGPGVIIFFLQR